ncbi:hypothetical protein [Kitasatospora sp. GAS204B]|uniref:hypothetical protein n=1 Tax=unclassified Kitasatospora TaxID=2633591 RepID=UPI0024765859|nr:hypothetical protein [Kitasatospora sp. GAS204B]MDH6122912.1 hypothetical protein [Kitasatospora sp. GAS204B]
MRTITKRAVQGLAATALAIGGIAAATGTANAASDQYCQHGTCLTGTNYNGWATGQICNGQSSTNDFYLWLRDDNNGSTYKIYTGRLNPGGCSSTIGMSVGNDPVQVFASSTGNWTYGTDPIYPN